MSPATTASADGIWKNVECSVSPCPTGTVRTRCPPSSNSGSASALGTTGASGSSPGNRDVQYWVVLFISASHAARAATSAVAKPRASGKCSRSRARPSQWSEWPVGDVDASDALAETLGPLCQGVCLTVGHQGVNED